MIMQAQKNYKKSNSKIKRNNYPYKMKLMNIYSNQDLIKENEKKVHNNWKFRKFLLSTY